MELDDLKKSWNALDEHLKSKEFIEEKEIAQLLGRARNKMNSIDRFNRKLRFASIGILTLAVLFWICADTLTDLFYWITLSLCIPALCWDLYSAHYLSRTRIDEMPLVTVISRINRYHRWMVREWIIGILYLLGDGYFFLFPQASLAIWCCGNYRQPDRLGHRARNLPMGISPEHKTYKRNKEEPQRVKRIKSYSLT